MREARRIGRGEAHGKILTLHRESRSDIGRIAAHLLAALGREEIENEEEHVRAYVGAMHLAEGLVELRNIRQILVKVFSEG